MLGILQKTVGRLFTEGNDAGSSAARSTESLEDKMVQFVAAHPGKVYDCAIPAQMFHHGLGAPVSHYARIEYASGDTHFAWFTDAESAHAHVEHLHAHRHPNVKLILGPSKLPKGRGEQFR